MDGLEFGRETTAMAFSIDRSFRFGGELPEGHRSVAAILDGWRPRNAGAQTIFSLRWMDILRASRRALRPS